MTEYPIKKALLLMIWLLLATGCAVKTHAPDLTTTPDTVLLLDQLVSEQEYTKALETLEALENKIAGEDYDSRKRQISRLINEFEKNTIAAATAIADREDMPTAISLIDTALMKVPASKELSDFHLRLIRERERRMEEAQTHLLFLEAEYLLGRLKWYKEQSRLIKPSLITRWQMSSMEGSLDHLRDRFLACEKKQQGAGNPELAAKCQLMATRIHPESSTEKNIPPEPEPDQVKPEELFKTKKSRPAQPVAAPPAPTADPAANQSPEQNTTSVAREIKGSEATEEKPENPTRMMIEQYMQEGASLYRTGKISEARDTWLKVLDLDSEHQAAQEQIARAEKVLKRLDSLKKANETSEKQ
ncbi:MAG: hypothetical protein KKG47_16505 [Proteobacteria bacterium]|nr:hypothetical protein [Pseudomonadota bacterium]MBU1739655.1 hypothetical protein [Pseudomonadota bacterium]